jgi:hypothetical protein
MVLALNLTVVQPELHGQAEAALAAGDAVGFVYNTHSGNELALVYDN